MTATSYRLAAIWLMPVALVALSLGARALAGRAWTAFTQYRTPFALRSAAGPPTRPLARQVVIVLVDGLAYNASRAMPFLNELRARGADLECRVGLPSLSLPGRAVLMTGAWPEVHGQTTNFSPRPLPVEHLFLTARRRGLRTALAAGANPHLWTTRWPTRRATPGARARRSTRRPPRPLTGRSASWRRRRTCGGRCWS